MIPLFKVYMSPTASAAVERVLQSGYIGQGPKVEEFEQALDRLVGRSPLTVSSCTHALDLALHLCGVGPGDEVVTTPITCTATNSVIVRRWAKPVWVDVDGQTGLIDPVDVGKKITSKTKAIMAVDWGGAPCDWAALKAFGLPVIEDAAHAICTPSGGDYVAYSFQAIKHLTTGDGGALVVPPDQVERARLLRWFGLDRRSKASFRCEQDIPEPGYKYHMNDIAAAIGIENERVVRWIVGQHRENARFYDRMLREVAGIQRPAWIEESSWWIYTLLVSNRAHFMEWMKSKGVEVSPVHARNDMHSGFSYPNGSLPGVWGFNYHQISIPVGWWVSQQDRQVVVDAVREWGERYGDGRS